MFGPGRRLVQREKSTSAKFFTTRFIWFTSIYLQPDDPQLPVLIEECASMHARFNDFKTATKYLEDLRKLRPKDDSVLVRLINTYVQFDPKKAEE